MAHARRSPRAPARSTRVAVLLFMLVAGILAIPLILSDAGETGWTGSGSHAPVGPVPASFGDNCPTEMVSTESTGSSSDATIAVDVAGNLHVAWQDGTNDLGGSGVDWDVFYKRRDATTGTWTAPEVVSAESTGSSLRPAIAVDGAGNLHVAWEDDTNDLGGSGADRDLFYKRRDATTGAWTAPEVVSTESTLYSECPAIAVDGAGNLHVAWHDYTDDLGGSGADGDVFYKRRDATTGAWTATEVVSAESTGSSLRPAIAVDGAGNLHVAWQDGTDDLSGSGVDWDVFYKRRDATTGAWTATEVVSAESTGNSFYVAIAVDGAGHAHVAWHDDTDNLGGSGADRDVFYKRRDATTGAWTAPEVVSTESTSNSSDATIAVDVAGNIHVAWQDGTNDLGGSGVDWDVFYKRRDATTGTWTAPEVVSAESTGNSFYIVIAVDGRGHAHVAWHDDTDDLGGSGADRDVFYKASHRVPLAPILATIAPDPDSDGTVVLDWNDGPGADNYSLYRHVVAIDAGNLGSATVIANEITASTWTDVGRPEGTWWYAVVARNDLGTSGPSNSAGVTVDLPPPAIPLLAAITPDPDPDGTVVLDWNDILYADNYTVYRHSAAITAGNIGSATVIANEITASTWTDVGRPEGTWWYAVVARNETGTSGLSNSAGVTVDLRPPAIPVLAIGIVSVFVVVGVVVVKNRGKSKVREPPRASSPPSSRQIASSEKAHIEEEKARVAQLEKILRVATRIEVARVGEILKIPPDELWPKIIDWADQFGFQIDQDTIVIERSSAAAFIESLEREFQSWGTDGKLE